MPKSHDDPPRQRAFCGCEIPTPCVSKPGARASACKHVTNWTHMMWCHKCALEKEVCFVCGSSLEHAPKGPVS